MSLFGKIMKLKFYCFNFREVRIQTYLITYNSYKKLTKINNTVYLHYTGYSS